MSCDRARTLRDVLQALPQEWLGTTFKNKELLGRERWSAGLEALLAKHCAAGSAPTSRDLEDLGNAEDYLRVASNVSTLLEHEMARKASLPIAQARRPPAAQPYSPVYNPKPQVFSFTSTPVALLAVAMASTRPVCAITSDPHLLHSIAKISRLLAPLGKALSAHGDAPPPPAAAGQVVRAALDGAARDGCQVKQNTTTVQNA
jgi:hypothetical protein